MIIIAYILFNIWASLSGIKESIIYSLRGAFAFSWDEHDLYIVERCLVFSFLIVGMYLTIWDIVALAVTCFLSFFFWHDGFYELGRGWIDQKGKKFTSTSSTSTAKWNPNWEVRVFLMLLSLSLLAAYLIIK